MKDGLDISYSGVRRWYVNNRFHKIDGPAIEYPDGHKFWWINGEIINCKTLEEFERIMKLKAFW